VQSAEVCLLLPTPSSLLTPAPTSVGVSGTGASRVLVSVSMVILLFAVVAQSY
jgi:hypothetical protein